MYHNFMRHEFYYIYFYIPLVNKISKIQMGGTHRIFTNNTTLLKQENTRIIHSPIHI
jgi:hypothetical protein